MQGNLFIAQLRIRNKHNRTAYIIIGKKTFTYKQWNLRLTDSYFSTIQILENIEIKADDEKGREYFQGSVTFMKTLNEVLDKLIASVSYFRPYFTMLSTARCNYKLYIFYCKITEWWKWHFQVIELAAERLHKSFIAQVWGVSTLCVVLIICPLLGILSKNAIKSIQVKYDNFEPKEPNEE